MYMKCPECGSRNIEHKQHESMCKDCGLVLEDEIPQFSAYREGTSITGPQATDGRIVKAQWLLSCKEKNLLKARTVISMAAERLSLPGYIRDQAYKLYEKAVHMDLCVGRDNDSIMYACIYASCNQNNIPKTAMEIIEYAEVSSKKLLKVYALIKRKLRLKTTVYDPVDLLPRFISKLGLSHQTLIKSIQILNSIKNKSMYSGKNPKSIIAAVIYISAKLNKEKITQRAIANQIGIMEVTIRKRYKEIVEALGIDIKKK